MEVELEESAPDPSPEEPEEPTSGPGRLSYLHDDPGEVCVRGFGTRVHGPRGTGTSSDVRLSTPPGPRTLPGTPNRLLSLSCPYKRRTVRGVTGTDPGKVVEVRRREKKKKIILFSE